MAECPLCRTSSGHFSLVGPCGHIGCVWCVDLWMSSFKPEERRRCFSCLRFTPMTLELTGAEFGNNVFHGPYLNSREDWIVNRFERLVECVRPNSFWEYGQRVFQPVSVPFRGAVCPVCMDSGKELVVLLRCKHLLYEADCSALVENAWPEKMRCPVCRDEPRGPLALMTEAAKNVLTVARIDPEAVPSLLMELPEELVFYMKRRHRNEYE